MSGIIKSERASERVRAFLDSEMTPVQIRAEPDVDPALASAHAEIAQLRDLLQERETELEDLRQALDKARRDGEAQGRKAGFTEGSRYAEQAIAALSDGVNRACEKLADDVEGLERLALAVAEAALERVLGVGVDQRALIGEIVARQIEHLGAQAILFVEVSGQDFALRDLQQLKERHSSIEFRASDELARGGCRIKLRLGVQEVGPNQQWTALKTELSEMAAGVSS
jgi:type III secretion protein L